MGPVIGVMGYPCYGLPIILYFVLVINRTCVIRFMVCLKLSFRVSEVNAGNLRIIEDTGL